MIDAIAHIANGADHISAQFFPQSGNLHFDRVVAHVLLAGIQFASDFLGGDQRTLLEQKQPQQSVFVAGQIKTAAIKPGTAGVGIKLKPAELALITRVALATSDRHPDLQTNDSRNCTCRR